MSPSPRSSRPALPCFALFAGVLDACPRGQDVSQILQDASPSVPTIAIPEQDGCRVASIPDSGGSTDACPRLPAPALAATEDPARAAVQDAGVSACRFRGTRAAVVTRSPPRKWGTGARTGNREVAEAPTRPRRLEAGTDAATRDQPHDGPPPGDVPVRPVGQVGGGCGGNDGGLLQFGSVPGCSGKHTARVSAGSAVKRSRSAATPVAGSLTARFAGSARCGQ